MVLEERRVLAVRSARGRIREVDMVVVVVLVCENRMDDHECLVVRSLVMS